MVCPSCGAPAAVANDRARFCASCGAPLAASEPAGIDDTLLSGASPDETRLSSSDRISRPRTVSGSGWLSSTADIDHGRFAPGDRPVHARPGLPVPDGRSEAAAPLHLGDEVVDEAE